MTLTIYEGYTKDYVIVKQAGNRGLNFKVYTANLYKELQDIASFVNNELGEECLFEVD